MSPRYPLDTNVLSEPLRPRPNAAAMARLQQHQAEIATATVVWHELWFGCLRLPDSKKRRLIEHYLRQVIEAALPRLAYADRAARWHARERARLTKAGQTPAFADGQIAAIASVNSLVLVTRNVADYVSFEGVQLENWHLQPQ